MPGLSADLYSKEYFLEDCGDAQRFSRTGGLEIEERLIRALWLARLAPGMAVLDIGCGRGELALHAAFAGAQVWACDYSADALALTRKTLARFPTVAGQVQAVQLTLGELDNLHPQRFDRIFLLDIVEHLTPDELHTALSSARQLLAPGGYLVLHTSPNAHFHRYGYPLARLGAALGGTRLPRDLRSPYEKQMHINEQSRGSLRRALRGAGLESASWLTGPLDQYAFTQVIAGEPLRTRLLKVMGTGLALPFFLNNLYGLAWPTGRPCPLQRPRHLPQALTRPVTEYRPFALSHENRALLSSTLDVGVNDLQVLGEGWHGLENWGDESQPQWVRWSASRALLVLAAPSGSQGVLHLELNADRPLPAQGLYLTIKVSGSLPVQVKLAQGRWQEVQARAPATGEPVRIELEVPPFRPSLTGSPDTRELGVALRRAWIT